MHNIHPQQSSTAANNDYTTSGHRRTNSHNNTPNNHTFLFPDTSDSQPLISPQQQQQQSAQISPKPYLKRSGSNMPSQSINIPTLTTENMHTLNHTYSSAKHTPITLIPNNTYPNSSNNPVPYPPQEYSPVQEYPEFPSQVSQVYKNTDHNDSRESQNISPLTVDTSMFTANLTTNRSVSPPMFANYQQQQFLYELSQQTQSQLTPQQQQQMLLIQEQELLLQQYQQKNIQKTNSQTIPPPSQHQQQQQQQQQYSQQNSQHISSPKIFDLQPLRSIHSSAVLGSSMNMTDTELITPKSAAQRNQNMSPQHQQQVR